MFFEISEQQNTINSEFSCASKPKTTVFTMFFASGSKNHGIYFCHVARSDFSMQKSQNPCKLQRFGSDFKVCDGVKGGVGGS